MGCGCCEVGKPRLCLFGYVNIVFCLSLEINAQILTDRIYGWFEARSGGLVCETKARYLPKLRFG